MNPVEKCLNVRGETNRIAAVFGVDKSAVSHWRKRGVPADKAEQFAKLTGNRFTADELINCNQIKETNNAIKDALSL